MRPRPASTTTDRSDEDSQSTRDPRPIATGGARQDGSMHNKVESRFVSAMRRLYSGGAVILIPVMTVLITADTGLRYLVSMPLVWAHVDPA